MERRRNVLIARSCETTGRRLQTTGFIYHIASGRGVRRRLVWSPARMFEAITQRMQTRSAALLMTLDNRLDRILQAWLLLAGLLTAARIAFTHVAAPIASFSTFASYMLLVVAPFGSTLLALRWFRDGHLLPQPQTRLAVPGRWRTVSRAEAERHPLYGSSGIMASLLVGMMLNVPVRTAEYLAAMPPIGSLAPKWLS